jgi:CheY-like chemotaxis protein
VYFPRAETSAKTAATTAPAASIPTHGGKRTILVVEDADGLRGLARRLLERLGYTVLLAANADEAYRTFIDNPSIDVLLTDVVMPGASGAVLTERLLAERPDLRLIYTSGGRRRSCSTAS